MSRLSASIWNRLPRRRGRFWRYVSPQRRGAGVIVLALLTVLVYGYWHQTNDRRIRRNAEQYLRKLTGLRVNIHRAHFSFFGGIELEKVSLHVPGAGAPEPFFRAKKVLMRHRPWGLLLGGRIRPTEIVCSDPIVTLEYEAESGAYSMRRLFAIAQQRHLLSTRNRPMDLPVILVRSGKLKVVDIEDGNRIPAGELPIELSMIPRGRDGYLITFEEAPPGGQEAMTGQISVDLKTGRIAQESGDLFLERMETALPRRYRQWRELYNLTGKFRVPKAAPIDNLLEVDLIDVSMKLPPDEGGLELLHVRGKLVFDPNGVKLEGVTGRIPQAGGARFEVSGQYFGYDAAAPYELVMLFQEMSIPDEGEMTGALGEAIENLRRTYRPGGRMDVSVTLERDTSGRTICEGTITPRDMSALFKGFPYPLEDIRGTIAFGTGGIELREVTARRGKARFEISGSASNVEGRRIYDITVNVKDAALDDELRSAIPANFQRVWEALDPTGRSGANVHVYRRSEDETRHVDVHLAMDGHASIQYEKFPYRLSALKGGIHINGRNVRIDSVVGRRGPASCKIDGEIKGVGTADWSVQLTVTGTDLPLDEVLAEAVGQRGRAALKALRAKGAARDFDARIWRTGTDPLDYRIVANLEDVTFNLEAFPYEVARTSGTVTIRPERAIIENLRGVHGEVAVSAIGQVHLGERGFGLDVRVEATGVEFDEDLHAALPEKLKKVWAQLSPSGQADMSLSLRRNLPDCDDDYLFVLRGRDMEIRYSEFPYRFRGVSGEVVARPGEVLLKQLTSKFGQMRGTLDGIFRMGEDGERAELTVTGTNIPIDADLLAALPGEFAPLAERFDPGGTCDIDLKQLRFFRPNAPATRPVGADTPSSPARPPTRWTVDGSVTLRDAAVNLGFGTKAITGRVAGTVERNGSGLGLDAEIDLQSVVVGKHRVSDLRGRLVKSPTSSVMKLENLEAKAHGGRLAGFALVELTDPLRYKISLLVDGVRLEELFFPDGRTASTAPAKMTGLLDGRIELMEQAGDIESRQASGVLRVSRAKLYKLPVILDLLTVVFLALPQDTAFTEGEFIYHLRGNNLVFEEIHLRGVTLSLVGSGRMDMKTQELELNFLAGPPGKLPRLAGLGEELLTGILREIMEIEVRGTLTKPETRTKTLGSLEAAIRKLLSPGADRP